MKKLFSLFAAVLFAGSMMADSYTISFKESGTENDSGTGLTSTTIADYVATGAEYVSAVAPSGKVYNARTGRGLKFGNSSNPGAVTLTLATPVNVTSIVVSAMQYKDGEASLKIQDKTDYVTTADLADYTYTYATATEVSEITVGTATKRGYVKSVTVNYETGGVTPPEPTCTLSDFLGNGSGNEDYTNRFKVCLPEGVSVVNIQSSFGTEAGIYLTFPGADFGAVSLDATQYATQGAGMLLYVSAFLSAAETEVTIECGGVTYTITVLNANPETTPVVLPDPTNCAEAREAALSVEANNVPYKDSTIYSIQGYVTEIKTAYNDQFHNITFWMADAADGGQVLQAYRAACASADEAPIVGDKVTVTGALSKYNSTPQFMAGSTFVIDEHATPVVPQNLGEKTIAEFLTLANTVDTCVITGVVANIKTNTDGSYNKYGNFDLVDGDASVYVYGLLTAAGEAQKFQEMGVDAGDTLTVKAVYSLFNNAPQAKNAVFVAVKKAAVVSQNIEITISSITTPGAVIWTDAVAAEGWWQIQAENEDYYVSLSNISTTEVPGVYTVADLDADYTVIYAGETEIALVSGSVTLAVASDGTITAVGEFVGSDGNTYLINLTYIEPKAETTVTVTIANGELSDYIESNGLFGVSGEDANGIYVQLYIESDAIAGEYTEADFNARYTGLMEGETTIQIFSATVTVVANEDGSYTVTAALLCYNNTLYNVTMTIPAGEGIDNVDAAVKAIKSIVNGQVVIEKAGKTYNMNGAVIR